MSGFIINNLGYIIFLLFFLLLLSIILPLSKNQNITNDNNNIKINGLDFDNLIIFLNHLTEEKVNYYKIINIEIKQITKGSLLFNDKDYIETVNKITEEIIIAINDLYMQHLLLFFKDKNTLYKYINENVMLIILAYVLESNKKKIR